MRRGVFCACLDVDVRLNGGTHLIERFVQRCNFARLTRILCHRRAALRSFTLAIYPRRKRSRHAHHHHLLAGQMTGCPSAFAPHACARCARNKTEWQNTCSFQDSRVHLSFTTHTYTHRNRWKNMLFCFGSCWFGCVHVVARSDMNTMHFVMLWAAHTNTNTQKYPQRVEVLIAPLACAKFH